MKKAIAAVVDGNNLTREEAQRVAELILTGQASEIEIAGLLTALRMKGETVDETWALHLYSAARQTRSLRSVRIM